MPTHPERESDIVGQLRSVPRLREVSGEVLKQVALEWLAAQPSQDETRLPVEVIEELTLKALAVQRCNLEARKLRASMTVGLSESLDDIHAIVDRHFEGASRQIADRHLKAVREERSRRITEGILEALGGEGATLGRLLEGVANSVANATVSALGLRHSPAVVKKLQELLEKKAKLTAAETAEIKQMLGSTLNARTVDGQVVAQVAQAVSQAVQQGVLNIQKIITVAIEEARSGDEDNPKYKPPY